MVLAPTLLKFVPRVWLLLEGPPVAAADDTDVRVPLWVLGLGSWVLGLVGLVLAGLQACRTSPTDDAG